MVLKWILFVGCGLALGGCVQHELIVDTKGVDEAKYEADLADCEAYADRVDPGKRAVQRDAGAAVVGAVVGAAIGDGRLSASAARWARPAPPRALVKPSVSAPGCSASACVAAAIAY